MLGTRRESVVASHDRPDDAGSRRPDLRRAVGAVPREPARPSALGRGAPRPADGPGHAADPDRPARAVARARHGDRLPARPRHLIRPRADHSPPRRSADQGYVEGAAPTLAPVESWDVVVVGAGPAGSSAAYAATRAGARTLVLDRAAFPRYKTCGGGLVGATLAALPADLVVPVRDRVEAATFSRDGHREVTKRSAAPLLAMVNRAEFDEALLGRAVAAGAVARTGVAVTGVDEGADGVRVRTRDGVVRARFVVGADGSASRVARQVGVRTDQVDLGLEVELEAGADAERWRGRMHMDWGRAPGSYGWLFPKGDRLTVGVIAARGGAADQRRYLDGYRRRLGLAQARVLH